MKETNYNVSAYPLKEPLESDETGMTLLDYFAWLAMSGIMTSNGSAVDEDLAGNARCGSIGNIHHVAKVSYSIAEAMLEARKNYIK